MAEGGETKGAVDTSQGWDEKWAGLDASGPKDLSVLPGESDCEEGNEQTATANRIRKGKGKGKEGG